MTNSLNVFTASLTGAEHSVATKQKLDATFSTVDAFRPTALSDADRESVQQLINELRGYLLNIRDRDVQALSDGMYAYYEILREEHNKLIRAHNESAQGLWDEILKDQKEAMAMGTELETLKTRVAELEAERVQREEEARERAYFEVGDEHLFGNRLRWAGRVMKYWWQRRRTGHAEIG